jgi:ADP-heptose:LPS heptosyltransferase
MNLLSKFIINILNKRNQNEKVINPENILILTYDKIGDMVLTTPMLRILKENYPDVNIDVFASSRNKDIIKYNPNIRNIYEFNNEDKSKVFKNIKAILKARKTKYDYIIDCWRKISLFQFLKLRFLRAKIKITPYKLNYFEKITGYKTNDLKIYDRVHGNRKNKHFSRFFIELLGNLNKKNINNASYDFYYNSMGKNKAKKLLSKIDTKNIVVFNTDSRTDERSINFKDIKLIVGEILKNKDVSIIVLAKKNRLKKLKKNENLKYDNLYFSYSLDSILEIGPIFEKTDVLISPDTSFIHIGCAFDIKIIGIYSNNMGNYKRFKPRTGEFGVVFSDNDKMNSIENFDPNGVVKLFFKFY